jgi:hypothetical protein
MSSNLVLLDQPKSFRDSAADRFIGRVPAEPQLPGGLKPSRHSLDFLGFFKEFPVSVMTRWEHADCDRTPIFLPHRSGAKDCRNRHKPQCLRGTSPGIHSLSYLSLNCAADCSNRGWWEFSGMAAK